MKLPFRIYFHLREWGPSFKLSYQYYSRSTSTLQLIAREDIEATTLLNYHIVTQRQDNTYKAGALPANSPTNSTMQPRWLFVVGWAKFPCGSPTTIRRTSLALPSSTDSVHSLIVWAQNTIAWHDRKYAALHVHTYNWALWNLTWWTWRINIKVAAGIAFETSVILTPCQVEEVSVDPCYQHRSSSPFGLIEPSVCNFCDWITRRIVCCVPSSLQIVTVILVLIFISKDYNFTYTD